MRNLFNRVALAGTIGAGLLMVAPAQAARSIVIDIASNSNALTSCGAFAGCMKLDAGATGGINISPNGFIEFLDFGGGSAHFSVAESATSYQILSGYTMSAALGRIDFIDFYAPGSSTAVLPSGNRPAPDFQIQLRTVHPRGVLSDLEIAFAYNDPLAAGESRVAAGATIGYSGNTLGTQAGAPLGFPGLTFAGYPAQQLITNSNGLLLGTQPDDSDFAFVVGNYPNRTFQTVVGLVSETFAPHYAATAPVPEPAAWTMLVMGFGAIGGGLRRTRSRTILAA